MQSYQEFIDLSVGFPQEGFEVIDDELYFHDLNLMEMIETYEQTKRGLVAKLTFRVGQLKGEENLPIFEWRC